MLNWTSNFFIWGKPNRVLLPPRQLPSSWILHKRISIVALVGYISSLIRTILKNWVRRVVAILRVFGLCLFSKECTSPVWEFLVQNYSIDGLSLHMMQVCIIFQGSRFEQTQNHQKPPWPGDFNRLMLFLHSGLTVWSVIIGLYMGIKIGTVCQVIFPLLNCHIFFQNLMDFIDTVKEMIGWKKIEFKTRSLQLLLQQNKKKIWLYRF